MQQAAERADAKGPENADREITCGFTADDRSALTEASTTRNCRFDA
ncbi:hypothetical protein [Actinoallomurus soli]|nr:hypothetical protein [Actinoallomurus soli]MCO5973167.1 hypothetical protein [Actinoallomurus soli]